MDTLLPPSCVLSLSWKLKRTHCLTCFSSFFRHQFQGKLCLDHLFVEPSSRNLGYGTDMLNWGKSLATQDEVGVGLLSPRDAVPFFRKRGFQTVRGFRVPGDELNRGFTHKWCVFGETSGAGLVNGTSSDEPTRDEEVGQSVDELSEQNENAEDDEDPEQPDTPIEWDEW